MSRLILSAMTILGVLGLGPVRAEESALAVFDAYVAAVKAGNLKAIESLVGNDAGRPPMSRCADELSNRDCLVDYLKRTVVTQHTVLTILKTDLAGDTVNAQLEVRNDLTRAAGVERFRGTDKVQVKNGKILEFAFVPDQADQQTNQFFMYMRSKSSR